MKIFNKFSSFILKIIAMVTMAFDHIGVVYNAFRLNIPNYNASFYLACRYIGRIALPLYCFLLVEAVINTKRYKRYNIKLGIMALVITIGLTICQFVPSLGLEDVADAGNIFIDLLLGSVMIYCLNHEKKWVKALAILPLAISILSFVAKAVEHAESCLGCAYTVTVWWYPAFIRLQYDWLSLAFMLGFFLSYKGVKLIYKIREEQTGLSEEAMRGTNEWRIMVNLFGVLTLVVISIGYYLIKCFSPDIVFWAPNIQLFAIVAGIFIVFYSGKAGYNKEWFKWLSYFFYPVHIAIIFGIFYLIFML